MTKNSTTTIAPFRVLSLDGGGMRGLYTATLLKTLAEHFSLMFKGADANADCDVIGGHFNLIAGTSTGGILAVALAAGMSLREIISLYKDKGLDIFPEKHSMPNKNIKLIGWLWKFLKKPSANHSALREHLEKLFEKKTLAEIYQKTGIALCIPCVDATTRKTVVIKTPHFPNLTRDGKRKAVDVCMATSAAPTYFQMATMPRPDAEGHDTFVDGGLWANNPVIIALIEALELAEEGQSIEIISVGTCNPPSGQTFQAKDCTRGLLDWRFGADALSLSLDAQAYGHDVVAQKLKNKLNVPCKIVRLPSNAPSDKDARHFGLDKAYKEALDVLESRAVDDARDIQSRYDKGESDIQLFASIFK